MDALDTRGFGRTCHLPATWNQLASGFALVGLERYVRELPPLTKADLGKKVGEGTDPGTLRVCHRQSDGEVKASEELAIVVTIHVKSSTEVSLRRAQGEVWGDHHQRVAAVRWGFGHRDLPDDSSCSRRERDA